MDDIRILIADDDNGMRLIMRRFVEKAGGERLVTSDSLSELDERLPDDMFFRTHKSYVVGLRHIDSITPYGRWTYVVKLRGTTHDALVTAERLEILQKMFA